MSNRPGKQQFIRPKSLLLAQGIAGKHAADGRNVTKGSTSSEECGKRNMPGRKLDRRGQRCLQTDMDQSIVASLADVDAKATTAKTDNDDVMLRLTRCNSSELENVPPRTKTGNA